MGMFKEFREFAVRGNVVDMAVGIIIGAAFGGIVKSVVDDLIMPPLGMLTGGMDFTDKFVLLKDGKPPGPYPGLEQAKTAGATVLAYGHFINTILGFILVAFAVFILVRAINRIRSPEPGAAEEPKIRTCPYCAMDIPKAARRCPHCTSEVAAA
jgi:large conductance mechanosensitive channel